MNEIEKVLKALANKRRLAIVKILNTSSKTSVGTIAKQIKLSLKSTSKHMNLLRSAGVLEREQVNLSMLYSLTPTYNKILKPILESI